MVHCAILLAMGTMLFMQPSIAQIPKFLPSDTILVQDGGDFPPTLTYRVDATNAGIDSITIRTSGNGMYASTNDPAHRIQYCVFVVRDSLGINKYNLWFIPQPSSHRDRVLISRTTFTPFGVTRGALSLVVSVAGKDVDSMKITCIPLLIGAAPGDDDRSLTNPAFELKPNYPNPFNLGTTITYSLLKAAFVSLKVFNARGQEVLLLVNGHKDPGFYQIQWNASPVASGIYFYRLQAGEFVETKKMMLMK
jgi:hypothetical protein